MFTQKQKELITQVPEKKATNAFVKVGKKRAVTTTALGNGAVKVTTTGNDFVDQFAKASAYKAPRSYADIEKDMQLLWSQDEKKTIQLTLYLRMISRVTQIAEGIETETTQRGQGLKHEGIMRMIWLAVNHPDAFWTNIVLLTAVGSWKDIIQMLSIDLQYNGWEGRKLDWDEMGKYILAGLENSHTSELLKKYLPAIRANKKCTTLESQADNMIAKWICYLLFGSKESFMEARKPISFGDGREYYNSNASTYKKYRQLKASGTAHSWQQLISRKELLKIDFNTIHGRALAQIVSGKFLKNAGLEERYQKWIESKPVAKYTGYVYELLAPVKTGYHNAALKAYQEMTINKQFLGMIETAKKGMKEGDSGLLVVVDSSSSMTSIVPGTRVSAYSVAKAMALYFSYLLKGPFENCFMEFADNSKLIEWKGSTPVQKLQNDRCEAYGGTNFQSVAKEFVRIKSSGVPESDFPSGILALSDGCFNHAGTNTSNFKELMRNLKQAGFSKDYLDKFKVILWDIPNTYYGGKTSQAFEEFADCPNLFHVGGLDPAVVAFITGTTHQTSTPKNSEELFEAAMDQEILQLVEL